MTLRSTQQATFNFSALFRKQFALPSDHGSWVFLISPLLIGLFAGQTWKPAAFFLVLAAFAGFLIRQPITLGVKAYSGRRPRQDLPAAWFWTILYSLVGLLAVAGLAQAGFSYLVILAVPAAPVFAWHLWLVSRRSERRQIGVEIVGSGVLALAAPAAYWVGMGTMDGTGWWLFGLTWFQSAASIVYAYLRLEQRELKEWPSRPARLKMGRRALLYTSFNFFAVCAFSALGWLPPLLPLPFALQWIETIYGTLQPAVGVKPTRIGVRQLIVSTLFTILFILVWR